MNLQPTFETLPQTAHHLILQLIQVSHPHTLKALRFVSKTCNTLVESLIYYSIVFSDLSNSWGKDPSFDLTKALIRRILNPRDKLRTYVRQVVIEKYLEDSDEDKEPGMEAVDLRQVIEVLQELRELCWNAEAPIPKQVLTTFHKYWPQAHLSVVNTSRTLQGKKWTLPDINLLGSPQLYSLKYLALTEGYPFKISELPLLKLVLTQAKNLRVLHLDVGGDISYSFTPVKEVLRKRGIECSGKGPMNFDFQEGDTISPLNELSIQSSIYDLSASHCLAWKQHMDWTRLTALDLGDRCPASFFTTLRDSLPKLVSLRFMFALGENEQQQCSNVSQVGDFLDSIHELNEVHITNDGGPFFEQLWPYLRRHLPTIRTLEVYTFPLKFLACHAWRNDNLVQLLQSSPIMETLSIDLKPETTTEADGRQSADWPRLLFSTLTNFSHLSSLALCLNLPAEVEIDEMEALDEATKLFRDFSKNNQKSRLEVLELRVVKIRYGMFNENDKNLIVVKVWQDCKEINTGFKAKVEKRTRAT